MKKPATGPKRGRPARFDAPMNRTLKIRGAAAWFEALEAAAKVAPGSPSVSQFVREAVDARIAAEARKRGRAGLE